MSLERTEKRLRMNCYRPSEIESRRTPSPDSEARWGLIKYGNTSPHREESECPKLRAAPERIATQNGYVLRRLTRSCTACRSAVTKFAYLRVISSVLCPRTFCRWNTDPPRLR